MNTEKEARVSWLLRDVPEDVRTIVLSTQHEVQLKSKGRKSIEKIIYGLIRRSVKKDSAA